MASKTNNQRNTTRYRWDGTPLRAVTVYLPFVVCTAAEKRIGKLRRANGRPCKSLKSVCETVIEQALG